MQPEPQTLTLLEIIELAREGKGMLIETPTGFHRIKTVFDNGWHPTVEIKTKSHSTQCTPNHILVLSDGTQKAAGELQEGDVLQTASGPEPFISRTPKGYQHVGDIEVDTPEHLVYGDGILQHNCISGVMSSCVDLKSLIDIEIIEGGTPPTLYKLGREFKPNGNPFIEKEKGPVRLSIREAFELAQYGLAFKVKTNTGYHPVKAIFMNGSKKIYRVSTSQFSVVATEDHQIPLSSGVLKRVSELKRGDQLSTQNGAQSVSTIVSLGTSEVGDLEVDHPDHLYFANEILVHNCVQCLDMDNAIFDVIVEEGGEAPSIEDNRPLLNNY